MGNMKHILIAELMARVLASGRLINRIYLSDDEYRRVMRETYMNLSELNMETGGERRVSLTGAVCYRLSEIAH